MGEAKKRRDAEIAEQNKHKAEILWESEGKTPAGDPFSTVKEARGYYSYLERGGRDSIAFILFDKKTELFGLIFESKPPMDEVMNEEVRMTTAFGGSIDMGGDTTYQQICQTEVREEAGYIVPLDKIYFVGETLVSTQMSQMCHTYLVDVTGLEKTEIAEYEKEADENQKDKEANEFTGNEVRWLDVNELMENGEWKSIYIVMQAIYRNIIQKS